MAHVVMNAQMNVDVGFSFNGALSYSIPPVNLVSIQSMVGAALSSLSLLGVNLRIGLDYGLHIRQGNRLHFTDFMSPQCTRVRMGAENFVSRSANTPT
jgi:hypothetical protein